MSFFNSKKKQKLLDLQNLILSSPNNKLVLSEQQIFQTAKEIAKRNVDIIQDCTDIICKTLNPDVFFSRYNLLLQSNNNLVELEPYLLNDKTWSETNQQFIDKKQYYIKAFIEKYGKSVLDKIQSLKTEKAKKARAADFLSSLKQFNNEMNADNISYYERIYNYLTVNVICTKLENNIE